MCITYTFLQTILTTGKFKVIILKKKINAKVTQTQFFNHYFSDKGLKLEKNNN